MKSPRRRFDTDQKATILKRYLVDKTPISDLCDEYGIKPNQIYAWQKVLFEHAESAFQQRGGRAAGKTSARRQGEKIARLEARLQQKNEVIAELMEENVRAKKASGEL
jgi:transposase